MRNIFWTFSGRDFSTALRDPVFYEEYISYIRIYWKDNEEKLFFSLCIIWSALLTGMNEFNFTYAIVPLLLSTCPPFMEFSLI